MERAERAAFFQEQHARMPELARGLGPKWAVVPPERPGDWFEGVPYFAILRHEAGAEVHVSFGAEKRRLELSMWAPSYGTGYQRDVCGPSTWRARDDPKGSMSASADRPIEAVAKELRRRVIDPLTDRFFAHMAHREQYMTGEAKNRADFTSLLAQFKGTSSWYSDKPGASELGGGGDVNGVGTHFKSYTSHPDCWELKLSHMDTERVRRVLMLLEDLPAPKKEPETQPDAAAVSA